MRIELLGPSREEEYAALVHARSESLVYASLPYRNFLRCVLPTSRDVYLVADDGGRMVGVLPAFLATVEGRGKALNSLPFFGSHGGVMTARDVDDDREVRLALLQAFNDLAESERVLSSTLISNPLSADADFYRQHHRHNYLDQRICQFTGLPVDYSSDQQPDRLLSFFHVKTRNAVRKGLKGGFDIRHGDKPALLKQLHDLHVANMTAIGGIPKEWSVFQAITEEFSYDDDYRVYVAEQDGHVAAALLLLYFNRTVEYFVPAIDAEARSDQPLSALIYCAMLDAVARGYRQWNWGGTWLTQSSVYRFKRRWGTRDIPYFYFVNVLDSRILSWTRQEILAWFPYYYVLPFNALRGGQVGV